MKTLTSGIIGFVIGGYGGLLVARQLDAILPPPGATCQSLQCQAFGFIMWADLPVILAYGVLPGVILGAIAWYFGSHKTR